MRGGVLGAMLACVALLLSACTLSDSLRHDDFRSVWARRDNADAHPTVFFVTDREADGSTLGFGLHWSAEPHCGTARLTIPTGFQPNRMPHWAKEEPAQAIACNGEAEMQTFANALAGAARAAHCSRVLLFVHGYNMTFRSAMFRAGQLASDTEWPCPVALFSWSSEGKYDRYVADVERSGYSVPLLIALMRATRTAGVTLEIITHSMGGRITLSALSALAPLCRRQSTGVADELILAAADVSNEHDNDDFAKLLTHAAPCFRRATVYASRNDLALMASESAHGGIPRAGSSPDRDLQYTGLAGKVDVIDASDAPGDPIGHGYIVLSYEMMADMMWTIAGATPGDRADPAAPGGPTLVCAGTGMPCERYALKVSPARAPDFKTRLLRTLAPVIFRVQ